MDHKLCKTSTGICGMLTAGQGKLSDHGYWEKPCAECEDKIRTSWTLSLEKRVAVLEENMRQIRVVLNPANDVENRLDKIAAIAFGMKD